MFVDHSRRKEPTTHSTLIYVSLLCSTRYLYHCDNYEMTIKEIFLKGWNRYESIEKKGKRGKIISYLYCRNWSTCIDHRPLCRICKLRRLCRRQLEEFRPPVHPRWPCERKRSALNYFLASKQEMEEIMKYMDG